MAKVNIISGNKTEEADKWLTYQNKEKPWDMPGLTASSHSEDSNDTEMFDPPPPSTMSPVWKIW